MIYEMPYMRLNGLQRRGSGVLSAYIEVFKRDLDRVRRDPRKQTSWVVSLRVW